MEVARLRAMTALYNSGNIPTTRMEFLVRRIRAEDYDAINPSEETELKCTSAAVPPFKKRGGFSRWRRKAHPRRHRRRAGR